MSTWALVLAGGEGRRLETLTTEPGGRRIPKQFCSLDGGATLLEEALLRAEGVCPRQRVCAIVTQHHRHWWTPALRRLPADNIIVQPHGRGTGYGILLPVLHILARDPDATVMVLPSDHHVEDEVVLRRAMKRALAEAAARPNQLFLLGVQPDEADGELGYVLGKLRPGDLSGPVQRFVEKPAVSGEIRTLIQHGAMWNSFIMAASAAALAGLYERHFAPTLGALRAAVRQDRTAGRHQATFHLYEQLPELDFSREVLTGQEAHLQLVPVPACGWSDLGTPLRVERTLRRRGLRRHPEKAGEAVPRHLVLREQFERLILGMRSKTQ